MKNRLYYILLAIIGMTTLFVTSCKDENDDYQELVPPEYDKILSIKDIGVQTVELSVDDITTVYQLSILKGGIDIDQPASGKLKVLTQQELDEDYNGKTGANYKILAQNAYTITQSDIVLAEKETGVSIGIELRPQNIYIAMKNLTEEKAEYVLPLRLESETDKVNAEKNEVLLRFKISPVTISFKNTYRYLELASSATSSNIVLELNKTGKLPVVAKLEIMTQEEVDRYYTEPLLGNDGYKVVDASTYQLPESTTISEADENIAFTIYPDKIYEEKKRNENKTLVIPVRLTTTTEMAIIEKKEMLLYCFQTAIEEIVAVPGEYQGIWGVYDSMKPFKVVYGSYSLGDYHEYIAMFDGKGRGDRSWMTYVEDGWSNSGNYGNAYVVIDLGVPYILSKLGVIVDASNDCLPKGFKFYATDQTPDVKISDKEWNTLTTWGVELESDYANLDKRLRDYDKTIKWKEIGEIPSSVLEGGKDDFVWTELSSEIFDNKLKYRYVKMEVISATPSDFWRTGDRSRIWEFGVKRVTMINGINVD